jgi:hypothetical protein
LDLAIQRIESVGGQIKRDQKLPGRPVTEINLGSTNITDAGLKELRGLKNLTTLILFGPRAIGGVSVCMNALQEPKYVPYKGELQLTIISAKVRRRAREGIEVSFQVAVKGTTPIAFTTSQVDVSLAWPKGMPVKRGNKVQFPKTTPERITVVPGKPIVLTLDALGGFGLPEDWRELEPGHYSLEVWIRGDTKGQAEFDYHWLKIARTKPYPIVVN